MEYRTTTGICRISSECSLWRFSHSTIRRMPIKKIVRFKPPMTIGMDNIDKEILCAIKFHASAMLWERKIIQPMTTRAKVKSICKVSRQVGRRRPSATWLVYLRFAPRRISGRNNNAWYAPHARNVQLAPCQMPETKKMTKVLRTIFHFPTREPPNGM